MSNLLKQIKEESKTYAVSNIADIKYGFGLPERNRSSGSIPVYASSGIVGFHNESRVMKPSIIIGRKGNVGSLFYSETPSYPIDTVFFIDEPKVGFDLKYIYYLLKRVNLPRYGGDSAVPGLSRETAYSIDVEVPLLSTQKKVAEILSLYDAKIENNNLIIKKLGATAKTLFSEWFVKFRFPGYEKAKFVDSEVGEIPDGWEVKKLEEISEIIFGFNFKSKLFNEDAVGVPVVRIRDVMSGKTKTFSPEVPTEEYKINYGDLLIGMDGTFHCSFWYTDGAYLNQRVARIRSNFPGYFIYESIKSQLNFLQKTITGATVDHLSNGDIRGFDVLIPKDLSILKIFENITNEILELKKENVSLRKMRDQLITKLI